MFKSALRFVGQAFAILVITLILDFILTATLFSGLKSTWVNADTGNARAYIQTPWHHDLRPDIESTRLWGSILYPWRTDRFGLRTGTCAPSEPDKDRESIFVIGDSFTEALGSTYEQSFTGLMACDAAKQGKAVYNLGVASYSPAIYHLKIKAVADRLQLKPAEIFVFLDLSDIDDDANVYRVDADGVVRTRPPSDWSKFTYKVERFFMSNFATVRFVHALLVAIFSHRLSLDRHRARWSLEPAMMESWGRRGLDVAGANLDRVVAICRDWQCRVTLVVYPWPDSIAAGDRDGIQVRHWRDWAAARGVRFVDGFAPFFREPAAVVIGKYFIPGDVHFTDAGNRLLYDAVRTAVGGDW